jgi:hypothetical protein
MSATTTDRAPPAGGSRDGAWYRQRWPWLLMAGPAIVVVAATATLWLAVASDDGLVADDYYRRGLAINKTLAREGRGEALRAGAVVVIAADGSVRADVTLDDAAPPPGAVRLRLVHPTRAGRDALATLARARDGSYAGRVEHLPPGRWLLSIETDGWRLPSVETVAPGEARLGTARIAR